MSAWACLSSAPALKPAGGLKPPKPFPRAVASRLAPTELTLDRIVAVDGPNFDAERGLITARKSGVEICRPTPERRFYPAGGQTTSEVAICTRGMSHLYVVLGERRAGPGAPVWLVRAYWNPLALLIFLGPVVMALGGLLSLSDRRLRLGVGKRSGDAA